MSREFDETATDLQTDLQPAAPDTAVEPVGLDPVRDPGRSSTAPKRTPQPVTLRAHDVEIGAPEPTSPAGDPEAAPAAAPAGVSPYCRSCKRNVEPNTKGACPHCGRFLPSNTAGLAVGLRSRRMAGRIAALRQQTYDALVSEWGGLKNLNTLTRARISNFAHVHAQRRICEAYIEEHGPMTDAGKRRAAVEYLMTLSATEERIGEALRMDASNAPARSVSAERVDPTLDLDVSSLDAVEQRLERMLANVRMQKTLTSPPEDAPPQSTAIVMSSASPDPHRRLMRSTSPNVHRVGKHRASAQRIPSSNCCIPIMNSPCCVAPNARRAACSRDCRMAMALVTERKHHHARPSTRLLLSTMRRRNGKCSPHDTDTTRALLATAQCTRA